MGTFSEYSRSDTSDAAILSRLDDPAENLYWTVVNHPEKASATTLARILITAQRSYDEYMLDRKRIEVHVAQFRARNINRQGRAVEYRNSSEWGIPPVTFR